MSDVALLLHTLNTERRPMGLPLTQGTLAASVQNVRSVYRLVETDATVVVLPLFHAHGLVCGLLSSLASGASVWLPAAGRFSASTFWDDMRESGATWYIGEPTIHQTILDRYACVPEAPYRALRFISTYDPSLELAIQGRLLAAFGAPVVLQAHEMLEASHLMTSVIIVGAGPSGISVAACLREKSVPFMVLERDDCIAPLWQKQTYDGLKLHLPKRFHELPRMAFHDHYPEYPTSRQYVDYLKSYAAKFEINPEFNTTVLSARYDETSGLWRVRVRATDTGVDGMEYIARWLVVTTGENAQSVVPNIPGLDSFTGEVTHVGDYNSGEAYRGKSVLVVGSGNSGMEVALDLFDHGARPAVVARNGVHVLPREVFGKPTLELASMLLEDWRLPLWAVDKVMALLARVVLGDLAKLGLRRPTDGPLERKGTRVRTPVFDGGTLERIRAGDIAVFPAVARFGRDKVEFVNGRALDIDAVVLATGRRSNMPQAKWHGDRNGYPAIAFPYSWDGYCGLYAVGFSRRSFGGSSTAAVRVAEDIGGAWRAWREGTEGL
ncbi:putative indole-3-pyruvate monooxygenase YUCCA8 [Dichanthelium oligosanthes]|uniref:Flavin-containing monooxygenase n=1 Tax=Dichanthelium oligosanthes TaxID=888268 RepID=A0A1E5VHU5_9POAL|nr:putative indole-3-pyruvate monooxygenase YUCCA8 [Dichanthelium oligosanthes]